MWFFFKKSILKAQLFKNAIWSSQSLSVLSPKLPNLPASFIFRTWDTTESQDASDLHCLSRPAEDPPGAQPTYRSAPGQAQPLGLERQLQLGTIELSVSFSPKQSDLFYFFLKGNIPAWAIWFFCPSLQRKQKVRGGVVTVFNMNKTYWGRRDLLSKGSSENVPFGAFTLKWIQISRLLLPASLRSQSDCFYGTQSTHL